MRPLLTAGILIVLTIPTKSNAQSNFDGTWKVDFSAAMPKKVNVWMLQYGRFRCISCSPTIEVQADGEDHSVKGQPYDTISVKIVDDHTVREIEKKNGLNVSDEKLTVSGDGNTATDEFGNWKLTMTRIAKAPAGAHALSGSWQPSKMESISDRELLVTYKLEDEIFSMSRPTGQSYTAKIDGTNSPCGNSSRNYLRHFLQALRPAPPSVLNSFFALMRSTITICVLLFAATLAIAQKSRPHHRIAKPIATQPSTHDCGHNVNRHLGS